ncbi:MAG: prepilin-type N-terminal cleavage/methylation domain-containing protein [Patescibacteria group bacterium]
MTGKKSGFTLIEALSVVAIIGILVSLAAYVVTQAQRQARDTKRKADLAAIATGFEARFLDRTCSDGTVGQYPGSELGVGANGVRPWYPTSDLSQAMSCNPFSVYLANMPTDSFGPPNQYYFNLSGNEFDAKHYRLAARLEREPSDDQWLEICRLSDVWSENFYGQPYEGCGGTIGRIGRILLAATLPNTSPAPNPDPEPEPDPDPNPNPGPNPGPGTDPCETVTPDDDPPGGCGTTGGNELFQLPYNYYIGR